MHLWEVRPQKLYSTDDRSQQGYICLIGDGKKIKPEVCCFSWMIFQIFVTEILLIGLKKKLASC